ncbi:MAG: protein-glutamate O-methyltransferase CheR [Nitrospirota bacterium]
MNLLAATANEPELNMSTYVLFRDYVQERTGIVLASGKRAIFEARLWGHISGLGFRSFEEYFYYISKSGDLPEQEKFLELMTVNETFFFRDKSQLRFYESTLIPIIRREASAGKKFRCLCAGCSTGEEPYTLALIAMNAIPSITPFQFEITGADISRECINKARMGLFSQYAVRRMPKGYLERFFVRKDEAFLIKNEARAFVKFDKTNISSPADMDRHRNINAIFCKNVFIYFSEDARERIAASFYKSLVPDGCLVLGPSEYLKEGGTHFVPEKHGECVYYRKACSGE